MQKTMTIIIADDEEVILDLIGYEFNQAGFNIIRAENGEQAFDKARSFELASGHPIDLVISDIRMPVCSGYGLVKRLRSAGMTALPVILITGFSGFEGEDLAPEGIEVVSKPFKINALVDKVQTLLKVA